MAPQIPHTLVVSDQHIQQQHRCAWLPLLLLLFGLSAATYFDHSQLLQVRVLSSRDSCLMCSLMNVYCPLNVHPRHRFRVRPLECDVVSFRMSSCFFLNPWCPRWGTAQLCADAKAFRTLLSFTSELDLCPARMGPVRGVLDFCLSSLPCLSVCPRHTAITYNNSRGALVILRVSGAPCGPILMSHMWPVKKDPSDLPIRLITTQYILMSRVRSYTYNIHIHSTHAGIYMCINDRDINSLLVIFFSFIPLFCSIMTNFCAGVYFSAQMLMYQTRHPLAGILYCVM